jgi:hypothetical protein
MVIAPVSLLAFNLKPLALQTILLRSVDGLIPLTHFQSFLKPSIQLICDHHLENFIPIFRHVES